MIYIKRLNFCYIRVPKNASSTIMTFLYNNVCNPKQDIVSRAFEWDSNVYEKIYHLNCPVLPHSHIDATYVIDNSIVPKNATFKSVIRHPYERQLSLYFYRVRVGGYGHSIPSISDFKSRLKNGVLQDTPQQMQSQVSFLQYDNNNVGDFWLFDNINKHLYDFCEQYDISIKFPIKDMNVSPGNKKQLVDIFYDDYTKAAVKEQYSEDFALYEQLKHIYRV